MKKMNKGAKLVLFYFKTYHEPTVNKRLYWICIQFRNIGPCNRIETPEIHPHIYGQLMFGKDAKIMQWVLDIHVEQNDL